MKKIAIFAGTTEGRKLSEYLAEAEIAHTICVATEYGEIVLKEHPLVKVHQGRMNQEEIESFLKDKNFAAVVDATHPFAKEITYNIKTAIGKLNMQGTEISYMRLNRDDIEQKGNGTEENIRYFETNEECAEALTYTEGNILLTTGSKELSKYCISEELRHRLYVRVLPAMESLLLCMEQGICGKQVIAMQGPFTAEMNAAVIRQYQISCLVTKESGISGGYQEKLTAAKETGIRTFVIGRPKENGGYSFAELCGELEKICGKKILQKEEMQIILAGIGMGNENCLTKEVRKAIGEADILLGAKRLLADFCPKQEKQPFYRAEEIIPYLRKIQEKNPFMESRNVVILFSGDSGFYSGCRSLYVALEKEIQERRLMASLHILPGISSVSYLASCIGESYHDVPVYSMHGKKLCNLIHKIKSSPKMFLLMSGVQDINRLGMLLTENDMTECEVITGYQLSYKEQRIEKLTPAQCCELKAEGLYTCFVKNSYAVKRKQTHGIADEKFIRDRVPMTKAEVREVSICKLQVQEDSVVYDIGSGTGSVAVEIAALSDDIQVYAIERKKEAVSLIQKNKEKFALENINIVEMEAPEGLMNLPPATHAFIGGSSGRLKEILETLRLINQGMRIVINAVSMETICEIKEIVSVYQVNEMEIVQLQVSRAKEAGNYHLMQAENPVWICAFNLGEYCEDK